MYIITGRKNGYCIIKKRHFHLENDPLIVDLKVHDKHLPGFIIFEKNDTIFAGNIFYHPAGSFTEKRPHETTHCVGFHTKKQEEFLEGLSNETIPSVFFSEDEITAETKPDDELGSNALLEHLSYRCCCLPQPPPYFASKTKEQITQYLRNTPDQSINFLVPPEHGCELLKYIFMTTREPVAINLKSNAYRITINSENTRFGAINIDIDDLPDLSRETNTQDSDEKNVRWYQEQMLQIISKFSVTDWKELQDELYTYICENAARLWKQKSNELIAALLLYSQNYPSEIIVSFHFIDSSKLESAIYHLPIIKRHKRQLRKKIRQTVVRNAKEVLK